MSIATEVKSCVLCDICKNMPNKPLMGIGNTKAKIMIIGEAPGEDEAIIDEPFVGACGKILDRILKESGINRKDIYITNLVKCRPTNGKKNRAPTTQEINNCIPFVLREIKAIKPTIVITLGRLPTYFLSSKEKAFSSFKLIDFIGKVYKIDNGINYIASYHPSYIMQYGKNKFEQSVEIFKIVKTFVEIPNVV